MVESGCEGAIAAAVSVAVELDQAEEFLWGGEVLPGEGAGEGK